MPRPNEQKRPLSRCAVLLYLGDSHGTGAPQAAIGDIIAADELLTALVSIEPKFDGWDGAEVAMHRPVFDCSPCSLHFQYLGLDR